MIATIAIAIAGAGEMDAPAPAVIAVDTGAIPSGPPREARVAPGDDLAALVRALPAGSRLVLEAGTHDGPLMVDRALEISGEPGAVLQGGGRGTVVVVAAPDVVLRDLAVTSGGRLPQQDDAGIVVAADRFRLERILVDDVYLGIDLRRASHGVVAECTVRGDPDAPFGLRGDGIRLWESHHNVVAGNVLDHVRDLVVWYSDANLVTGNRVSGSRYGTHLMHTTGNVIAGNVYESNVVGVFTMYSSSVALLANTVTGSLGAAGVGLGFKESDLVTVAGNRLVANTTGIYVDTTPHRRGGLAWIGNNLVAAHEVGLRFHGPQIGAVLEHNGFLGNVRPVAVDGGGDATGSRFASNVWSEYSGYDLDGDGIGDLPFELRSASGALRDRRPALAFFTGTPAAALLDVLASAFPMFAPKALLIDEAPRTSWGES